MMSSTLENEGNPWTQDLKNIWPELLSEIRSCPKFKEISEANTWLEFVLNKTVPNGKQFRASLFLTFCDALMIYRTKEEKKLHLIAAWCNEISQAAALIADDIMDESETRRGDLCWHRQPGVGICAVNDCLMLENITYHILYKFFEPFDYFNRLIKHVHEMCMLTIMGQCLDTQTSLQVDFETCTWERYKKIVKYKTSFYTFYHPIALAMIMARIQDDNLFSQIKEITLEIGYLFQVQDDFLDCFGDPKRTGKVGTDIKDGKCTWLLVTALDLASAEQKEILKVSYRQKGENEEKTVKQIYDDLRIDEQFFAFESETCRNLFNQIKKLPQSFPKEPLQNFVKKLYRRRK